MGALLLDMGFAAAVVKQALASSGGNIEQAIEWIYAVEVDESGPFDAAGGPCALNGPPEFSQSVLNQGRATPEEQLEKALRGQGIRDPEVLAYVLSVLQLLRG